MRFWQKLLPANYRRRNIRALSFFVLFYVGLFTFTAVSQERLIYQPSDQDFDNCSAATQRGLVPQSTNGTRFYAPAEVSSSDTVVVVYHGNAGSACDRMYYEPFITASDAVPLLVEYTGYSNHDTTPSHHRIKADVANITNYISEHTIERVIVIGESIGTGPASLHANTLPPDQLVLITPFTSLPALARHHYWYFPTDLVVKNAFDNVQLLADHTGPRTLIHGTEDRIIPFSMTTELSRLQPQQTTIIEIAEADHNNIFLFPEFSTALYEALQI